MIPIRCSNESDVLEKYIEALTGNKGYLKENSRPWRNAVKPLNIIKPHISLLKDLSPNEAFIFLLKATAEQLKSIKDEIDESKLVLNDFSNYHGYYLRLNESKDKKYYSKEGEIYNSKELVRGLGIKVCPYCNRQYITSGEKNLATIDHFYSQSKYPIFAISFYNLIPCCATCNRLKREREINILNPYNKTFKNDIVNFSLVLKQYHGYLKESDLKIILKSEYDYAKVFGLQTVFDDHLDYVLEIINKKMIFTDDFIKEINERFSDILNLGDNTLYSFLIGNYLLDGQLSLRPLAKITQDILNQLE